MTSKNVLKTVFIYLASILPFSGNSQQNSDLRTLWNQIVNEYPGLLSHDAHIERSKLDSIVALSQYWPKLHLQYQQSLSTYEGSNGAFYPMPGIFNVSGSSQLHGDSQTFNSYASSVATWDVIHFGRKARTKDITSTEIKKAHNNKEKFELDLQKEVANRYFSTLYYSNLSEWAKNNSKRLKEILETSKSLSISGLHPIADTLIASSSYRQVLAQQTQTFGMYEATMEYLNEFTSEKPNLTLNSEKFETIEKALLLENTLETLHPIITEKQLIADSYSHKRDLEKGKYFPHISLLGGLSSRTSGIYNDGHVSNSFAHGYDNRANNYFLGVGVTWSLNQTLTSSQKRKSLQFAQIEQIHNMHAAKDELQTQREAIEARVKKSFEQIKNSKLSVDQALEAYEMYLVRYEGGLINLNELLQIQGILQASEKSYLDNLYTFWQLQSEQSYVSADFSNLFNNF